MENIPPGMAAASLYIGLLMLAKIPLQIRVIGLRRSRKIGIGDGKDQDLARAIRVHGNFAENAPFAIGGLIMLALFDTRALIIHAIGIMLVAGRVLHAIGLTQSAGSSFGRVAGMALTFTGHATMGLMLVVYGLVAFGL